MNDKAEVFAICFWALVIILMLVLGMWFLNFAYHKTSNLVTNIMDSEEKVVIVEKEQPKVEKKSPKKVTKVSEREDTREEKKHVNTVKKSPFNDPEKDTGVDPYDGLDRNHENMHGILLILGAFMVCIPISGKTGLAEFAVLMLTLTVLAGCFYFFFFV